MAAGDAERRYVVGSGWQTVAVSASGIVTAADVDSDGAANGEVLTADGGGGASWEVGGGGSLPAWWTVDSTPGAESVEFGGAVEVTGYSGAAKYFSAFDGDGNAGINLSLSDGLELFGETGDPVFVVGPTGAVTISPSDDSATALQIRSDGDLLDAQNVAEEWGLVVGGDGRTRFFSDPSVDGHTVDISGGPNGSAAFRFLVTDSGLIDDLLQVWDDDNNQVTKIGPTGAVTISPSDAVAAISVDAGGGATAALVAAALPITGVADPTDPQDAATKNYVDTAGFLVASQATFVDPSTGSAEDIANALITAGLMAAA